MVYNEKCYDEGIFEKEALGAVCVAQGWTDKRGTRAAVFERRRVRNEEGV